MPETFSRHASVAVSVFPDRSRAVVTLAGELDMDARPELNEAVHHLTVAEPDRVAVDVSAVTFAGSVLPNFLLQIRKAMPAETVLTVSHPSPWTQLVLSATNMAEIAYIEDAA